VAYLNAQSKLISGDTDGNYVALHDILIREHPHTKQEDQQLKHEITLILDDLWPRTDDQL
jgi:hypothetical protein